jgi:D-alanine-D-alanine ligase
MNTGLIFGGRSVEHVISIMSARNVVAAIDKSRFQLSLIGIDRSGRWFLCDEHALQNEKVDKDMAELDLSLSPSTRTEV